MHIQRTKRIVLPGVLLLSLFCFAANAKDFQWEKITINENSKFETCGVGDINKDGILDIICGDWWYEGPKWTKYRVAKMEEINGYYNDFANELYDVDGDGDLDVISCAWFSKEVYWRENPGQFGVPWPKHVIDTPGNMETGFLVDINNDGEPDFFPDIAQFVAWYEKVPGKAEWIRHDVGEEGKAGMASATSTGMA